MRYIDIEDLRIPDGWKTQAQGATRDALNRGGIIGEDDAIWGELKGGLAAMFFDKCWFCETPITRSDNAVDHFRPKGRVKDATNPHQGYRWLALEPANFRYACTFCNSRRVDVENATSGGKADRFPLVNEAERVYQVDVNTLDFDDLLRTVRRERPALLDPCDLTDWQLLGCMRENGHPCSTSVEVTSSERVTISIEILHLHHEPTCKQRHRTAVRFLDHVRDAKNAFLNIRADDPETQQTFIAAARRVRRMMERSAAYSGEMIFLLRGQRSASHPWVQQLLEI